LLLDPEQSAPLAYVCGTLGVLLGADISRLEEIRRLGAPQASIGGAGTFDGIFNTIAPGLIDTDMPAGSLTDEARARMVETTPLKRIGRPEEMAELALFLLSDRSSFTTGQVYVADGGRVTLP
jgi:hypothetical protein